MKEITPEMMKLVAMYLNCTNDKPKKVKVTSWFYNYLKSACHHTYYSELSDGATVSFFVTSVVIDDEIENPYFEIEY